MYAIRSYYALFNKGISQKTQIVRVVKEIKTGERITKDMVEVAPVGGYNLPGNVIKTKDTVIGSFALADFRITSYNVCYTKLLRCRHWHFQDLL